MEQSSCESIPISLLGDFKIDCLILHEKENLDSVVLQYVFTKANTILTKRARERKLTLITFQPKMWPNIEALYLTVLSRPTKWDLSKRWKTDKHHIRKTR